MKVIKVILRCNLVCSEDVFGKILKKNELKVFFHFYFIMDVEYFKCLFSK